MKFYSVAQKTHIDVPENKVKVSKTKNGRYMASYAEKQKRLVRFISKADFERLSKK